MLVNCPAVNPVWDCIDEPMDVLEWPADCEGARMGPGAISRDTGWYVVKDAICLGRTAYQEYVMRPRV